MPSRVRKRVIKVPAGLEVPIGATIRKKQSPPYFF